MQFSSKNLLGAALLGGTLLSSGSALADSVRVHEHEGPRGDVRFSERMHADRFHRIPPDIRAHGFAGGAHMSVTQFHNFRGWRVNRFTPAQRAIWTHGKWWHGRHGGHLGWWWWVDGGWFFYDAPVYPYPGYVSDYVYDEPSQDYGDYWYYCRDPDGYYPYVQRCNGAWEPVPAQPEGPAANDDGYGPRDGYGPGDAYGRRGDDDRMGPDDQGPPDEDGPDDEGPPDEQGPPPTDGPPPR